MCWVSLDTLEFCHAKIDPLVTSSKMRLEKKQNSILRHPSLSIILRNFAVAEIFQVAVTLTKFDVFGVHRAVLFVEMFPSSLQSQKASIPHLHPPFWCLEAQQVMSSRFRSSGLLLQPIVSCFVVAFYFSRVTDERTFR